MYGSTTRFALFSNQRDGEQLPPPDPDTNS
jgi:hypothetical protein